MEMKITPATITSFGVAKLFTENTAAINSGSYSDDGNLFVTASDDNSIRLYNCLTGQQQKMVFTKKYGSSSICFTHSNTAVITASKNDGWDNSVHYLSLHDNRYLRIFKGHTDPIYSLHMSPTTDGFLSAGRDKTTRLWDLRTNACQGICHTPAPSLAAYDAQGLVFAIAFANTIKVM